jgi:hypothetical protein
MPLSRPNTVIYQEYADLSVVPATPFLNSLIVGPCYQLLDYLDDMDDCYAGLYGTLRMAYPRTTPTAAVVIATPPELETGAILEDDSVSIFFDEAQVVITEVTGSGSPTNGIFYASDNLFTTTNNTGFHMNDKYVQAGDTLIAQANGAADCIKTVKELAFTFYDKGAGNPLSFTTAGVDIGDIITVSADAATPSRDGIYTVKKKYIVNGSVVADAIEIEDATSLSTGSEGLAHVRITSAGGTKKFDSTTDGTTGKVNLGDWCNLRVTTDFDTANAANCRWRVERQLSDVELASSDFSVNTTTKAVTLIAGVTATVSTVIGAKPVSYAKMYMQYKALRLDLQNIAEVSSPSEAIALLGKYDARNPLCVGVHVALANTTTPIKCYGIAADTLAGYGDFIERTSHLSDIYAVTPLTYDTSIIGSLKDAWENYADPDYVLQRGIKQKFRTTLGAVDLVTQSDVIVAKGGASTLVKAGTTPTGNKTLTLSGLVGQTADFSAASVLPGDIVHATIGGVVLGPFTVAHVNTALILETEEALAGLGAASNALDTLDITDPTGVIHRFTALTYSVGVKEFVLGASVLDALYLTLSSSNSTFITSGVVPGDLLQMPSDPETTTWTTYDTWEVASVDSETRITIANNGNNSSDLENEFPHLVKRTAATDRSVTQGTLYFRVKRDMTKTEQVNYMLAVAHSLDSKRALLYYPNSVDVTDLVDGSKTRTGTAAELADPQPGYYLACMVAGQTASQPSQQGFTNMGGNGISRVYNSNDYFSEEQLTSLSNGGVYVFVQDAPTALPYTIHAVTTDVLSLETGEYMHVKNLDYLSMSFLETLRPFNGKWNITPDALQFITQALYAVITTHKTAYRARIGAPLINATVRTVYQNTDVEDRIEAYIDVNLPTVLNTIGLHLVS